MENNIKKIKITRPTESLQLSSLLFAPIFVPRKTGYSAELQDKSSITFRRTQQEEITFEGLPLDLMEDFPLFSVLVGEVQKQNKHEVEISEKVLFDSLNKTKCETNRVALESRIEKLKNSKIKIERFDLEGNKSRYFSTNLVFELDWLRDKETIKYSLSKHFLQKHSSETHFELIDLRLYKDFKTQYERAFFLYLETKKFKKQKTVDLLVDELFKRVTPNVTKNKEKMRKLKLVLSSMQTKGYIRNFDFFDSSVQKIKMLKIEKNHNYHMLERFSKSLE